MCRAANLEPHNGEPPMRTHAASCVLGSKVYVFGGLLVAYIYPI